MIRQFVVIALLLSLTLSSVIATKTCDPKMVKILFGDYYATNRQQNSNAKISFQSILPCQNVSLQISYAENLRTSCFEHTVVHSVWQGETFCHNLKTCESMFYDQYIYSFDCLVAQEEEFEYVIVENGAPVSMSFSSKMPALFPRPNQQQTFVYFGDMDLTQQGQETILALENIRLNYKHQIDGLMFLGDYAYEFYQNNGTRGDTFLESMSPFLSYWPTIFNPGNHEDNYNFTFFNQKFQLPLFSQTNNLYYSLDIGLVHYVSLNLNFYVNVNSGVPASPEQQQAMLDWFMKDLKFAQAQRDIRPWIIINGHVPLYCTLSDDCIKYYPYYQVFDELFHEFSVDLFLAGHDHQYEFLKPIYANQTQQYEDFGKPQVVAKPQGTIYVIQGNAGCATLNILAAPNEFSLYNTDQPGFGMMTVLNKNTIIIQSIDSKTLNVISEHQIYSEHTFSQLSN